MSGGLVALLDDVAALARLAATSVDDVAAGAARAGTKAAGVVIDDAAVTPQYVTGMDPARELPIIWRIARGSLRNKLLIILPVLLILSWLVPWVLTPILMLGGTYLCYEGAEKVWGKIRGHHPEKQKPAVERSPRAEDKVIKGAITTDFILSCEIMVISLNEVATEPLLTRALILVAVAIGITVLVYGAVAVIVKMDDIGVHLAGRDSPRTRRFGLALAKAMPAVLGAITVIGTAAMLWVGGHIILVGLDDVGWTAPYDLVHHLEAPLAGIAGIGPVLAWLVNTVCSAVLGLIWGLVVVGVIHLLPFGKHSASGDHRAALAGHRPAGSGTAADGGPDGGASSGHGSHAIGRD